MKHLTLNGMVQVRLACGSKVAIIVGQTGLPVGPGTGACGGGGGATFFLYPNSTTPLVIAGGGGGPSGNFPPLAGGNATGLVAGGPAGGAGRVSLSIFTYSTLQETLGISPVCSAQALSACCGEHLIATGWLHSRLDASRRNFLCALFFFSGKFPATLASS